jgi:hypothetical protein
VVDRPWQEPLAKEEENAGFEDDISTAAWTAPDVAALLAPRGTEPVFPQLTHRLNAAGHDHAHLSDFLRDALTDLPGRT